MRVDRLVVTVVSVLGASSSVLAQSSAAEFMTPVWRGDANTGYAGWERFQTAVGANTPDDPASSALGARVIQSTTPDFTTPPGILRTSAGNIYSGFQFLNLRVTNTVSQPLTDVVLQSRTSGTEINYSTIVLSYVDGQGASRTVAPSAREELFRADGIEFFPGFPSSTVEYKWTWDLSSLGEQVTSFSIALPHVQQHISIDRIELDTRSVPGPGTAAMLLLCAAARRRRGGVVACA